MAEVKLSERAASDLENIFVFSIETFGLDQAETYKQALVHCLNRLANDPRLGRRLGGKAKNYLRYLCQRHVIFYQMHGSTPFVVRVLHGAMDHRRHLPRV